MESAALTALSWLSPGAKAVVFNYLFDFNVIFFKVINLKCFFFFFFLPQGTVCRELFPCRLSVAQSPMLLCSRTKPKKKKGSFSMTPWEPEEDEIAFLLLLLLFLNQLLLTVFSQDDFH